MSPMGSDDSSPSTRSSCAEVRRARPAMGTLLQIVARGTDNLVLERAIEAELEAVARVDRLMSFNDPESELSRVNRSAAIAPVQVHAWTYAVLTRAQRVAQASAGLFDITVAPALIAQGLLPDPHVGAPQAGSWRDVVLLAERRVSLRRRVMLDLGGIAKGFAVDCAMHALRALGCRDAIVNAGGDLRAFGEELRPIHLRRRAGVVQIAQLRVGAIATSS